MAENSQTLPPVSVPADLTELLSDHSLSLEDLARACRCAPEWVSSHVREGVLAVTQTADDPAVSAEDCGSWRFSSFTVVRARRIADLERMFDADPRLAALTVDLMEEVDALRRRLAPYQ